MAFIIVEHEETLSLNFVLKLKNSFEVEQSTRGSQARIWFINMTLVLMSKMRIWQYSHICLVNMTFVFMNWTRTWRAPRLETSERESRSLWDSCLSLNLEFFFKFSSVKFWRGLYMSLVLYLMSLMYWATRLELQHLVFFSLFSKYWFHVSLFAVRYTSGPLSKRCHFGHMSGVDPSFTFDLQKTTQYSPKRIGNIDQVEQDQHVNPSGPYLGWAIWIRHPHPE